MRKILRGITHLGFCAILLAMLVGFTSVEAPENESTELATPIPISFKNVSHLMKNAVLVETINFELSESNPTITPVIPETNSDLIFVFRDVSSSINMSLTTGTDAEYCVGFHMKSDEIYVKKIPDLEYEFELSLGVVVSDDMKQTEIVDYCSGLLEIYQVAG